MVVERERGPVYYGKWRDRPAARSSAARAGLGDRDGEAWRRRRGRAPDGSLDERAAIVAMAAAMEAHEAALDEAARPIDATFADAAAALAGAPRARRGREAVDARRLPLLPRAGRPPAAQARACARGADHARVRRIARSPRSRRRTSRASSRGWTPSPSVDAADGEQAPPAAVLGVQSRDARRHVLARLSTRRAATDKRREPDARPIDFYEPEEVLALARAARAGRHRDPRGRP